MSRIPMITKPEDVGPERQEEFDAICAVLNRVSGPFSVMMHSPGLAQKVMEAGAHIRLNSTLTMGERELTILAVSREKDGVFEWSAHVGLARNNGVSEETIAVVRDRGATDGLPEGDREIIEYVRELLQTNRIAQSHFDALVTRRGARWVVELTGTIGQYQYIAAINNAFEVTPAEGAEILPV
jgi:4-carboxymuconolactone decarboxylase